jgi:hypothetical protein
VLYLKELAAFFMNQKDVLDKETCDLIVEKLILFVQKDNSAL